MVRPNHEKRAPAARATEPRRNTPLLGRLLLSLGTVSGQDFQQDSRCLAVVDDSIFDRHTTNQAHPERVDRLAAARSGLNAGVPRENRILIPTQLATDHDLESVHQRNYIGSLERALAHGSGFLDSDTYFGPHTREAARAAVGSVAALVRSMAPSVQDAPLTRPVTRGFALIRPPGHHALADRAMGFCIYNNIAVAARTAQASGLAKVAIVDWDVHHGNGTQAMFYDDPSVLFVSLHQWPFYPGTGAVTEQGAGPGLGKTVNLPLPEGSGPELYLTCFQRLVIPILERFAPDIILISAGYDAHERDPLANMHLDAATYGAMTKALVRTANQLGHGRVAAILEGGYDLRALEESVAATASALLQEGPPVDAPPPSPYEQELIARLEHALLPAPGGP